jgi:hypothetical protein
MSIITWQKTPLFQQVHRVGVYGVYVIGQKIRDGDRQADERQNYQYHRDYQRPQEILAHFFH